MHTIAIEMKIYHSFVFFSLKLKIENKLKAGLMFHQISWFLQGSGSHLKMTLMCLQLAEMLTISGLTREKGSAGVNIIFFSAPCMIRHV